MQRFQMNGNYNAAEGIAEMILQSHIGFIELIPAQPSDRKESEVKELVAGDGFVLDIK